MGQESKTADLIVMRVVAGDVPVPVEKINAETLPSLMQNILDTKTTPEGNLIIGPGNLFVKEGGVLHLNPQDAIDALHRSAGVERTTPNSLQETDVLSQMPLYNSGPKVA